MNYALLNGKIISAYEISKDYSLEKSIRFASDNGELRCSDPDCQYPHVIYRHGKTKIAHFAHKNKGSCDYSEFDKKNPSYLHPIREMLLSHFQSLGYKVQIEKKILDHHYTHIFIEIPHGNNIAIELATNSITLPDISELTEEYDKKKISLRWFVVHSDEVSKNEEKTIFIERFLLNESKNHDFILINKDDPNLITQCRLDTTKYRYMGQDFQSENYPEIYSEPIALDSIIIDNNEITSRDFNENYNKWLAKKQRKFNEKIEKLRKIDTDISSAEEKFPQDIPSPPKKERSQILYTCEKCGKTADSNSFIWCQKGTGQKGTGLCSECNKKSRI